MRNAVKTTNEPCFYHSWDTKSRGTQLFENPGCTGFRRRNTREIDPFRPILRA
jgi:hypothetical protein